MTDSTILDFGRLDLISKINKNEQIIFVKYGDGEINCMLGHQGENCDGDPYIPILGNGLIQSLEFYSIHPNAYIGRWHNPELLDNIIQKLKFPTPKFTDYHIVINDDEFNKDNSMYNLVESIQKTKKKKIIITNELNNSMKDLFYADVLITVPQNNWFKDHPYYFQQVFNELTNDSILITAAGQGSKVLIATALTYFPNISCIDIGSSFDILCKKKNTRGWKHTYEDEYAYYKNLLPEGF